MAHPFAWLAVLVILLFQGYSGTIVFFIQVEKVGTVVPAAVGHVLGIFLTAICIDCLVAKQGDAARRTRIGGLPPLALHLMVLPLIAIGIWWANYDQVLAIPLARAAVQFGIGILISSTLWLFFSLVPERWAAVVLFLSLGAGLGLGVGKQALLFGGVPEGEQAVLYFTRYHALVAMLFGLGVVPGLAAATLRPVPPPVSDPKAVRMLLVLTVLLYLLHGLVQGAFMPFLPTERSKEHLPVIIALTAAVYFPAAWLFGRDFGKGVRIVAAVCGMAHIIIPAVSLFTVDVPLLVGVLRLVGPVQFVFFFTVVVCLARSAPPRWRVTVMTAPFVIRAVEVVFGHYLLQGVPRSNELLPLTAVLVAVAFYALGQRLDFDALAGRRRAGTFDADERPPDGDGTAEETALGRVVAALAAEHGLSAREREVAALLGTGLTADRIGERLGLATNTVNTYARRIIQKTGCGRRKAFVAMVKDLVDAEN